MGDCLVDGDLLPPVEIRKFGEYLRHMVVNRSILREMGMPNEPKGNPPIYAGRVTKAKLLLFPEGSFAISNAVDQNRQPTLSFVMPAASEREAIWAEISSADLQGQRFYVFIDEADYEAQLPTKDWLNLDRHD